MFLLSYFIMCLANSIVIHQRSDPTAWLRLDTARAEGNVSLSKVSPFLLSAVPSSIYPSVKHRMNDLYFKILLFPKHPFRKK